MALGPTWRLKHGWLVGGQMSIKMNLIMHGRFGTLAKPNAFSLHSFHKNHPRDCSLRLFNVSLFLRNPRFHPSKSSFGNLFQ
jgi:hypothetical protein